MGESREHAQDSTYSLVDARGRKHLTVPERGRFLEAVRKCPTPETQTFALTLAHTGCRISECLAVRARDVDLEANEIRISTLKPPRTLACSTGPRGPRA